jgi:hypothetical protein
MQIRPLPAVGDGVWNLIRIDASQIAGRGNSTEPLDQYIQMDMSTPSLKFSKKYQRSSTDDNSTDDYVNLTCNYNERRQDFELNLTTYRRSMDSKNPDRKVEAQVTLGGKADFDMNTDYETVNMVITNSSQQQRPGFVAQFSPPRSRDIFFSLSRRNGRCDVSLTRQGTDLSFYSECSNVDANGDNIEGNSKITLRGNCILE